MTDRGASVAAALVLLAMVGGCSPSPTEKQAAAPAAGAVERSIRTAVPMSRECGDISLPELKGLVSDPANLIADADELEIEQTLRQYQASTGHEAVAVMLPTLNGKDDELVARCLGDAWSIGDEQRNDGVMLLLVPSEERVRVAMGLGFGSADNSNRKAQEVINTMMPALSRGDMAGGLKAGARSLGRILP